MESGIFDRIVVSTNDFEIARVSESQGIEVPFLRKEANDDISPVSMATITAVKQAQDHWKEVYDVVVQLMPNCPVRGNLEILDSYHYFVKATVDFQISCFRYGFMNPWWAARLDANFKPEFIFPESLKSRSQDLPELYCPTGAIWIAKIYALLRDKTFYGRDHIFYPIDWKAAVDIDDWSDVEFAEAAFNLKKSEIAAED